MKTIYKGLLIVVLFITTSNYAQLAVTAPMLETTAAQNLVKTGKIIAQGTKSIAEAKKTVDHLNKALKAVRDVSQYLFDAGDVLQIIKDQSSIILRASRRINNINSDYQYLRPSTVTKASKDIRRYIKDVSNLSSLTEKLLTTGVFKMNDAERLKFITEIKEKTRKLNDDLFLYEVQLRKLNRMHRNLEISKQQ